MGVRDDDDGETAKEERNEVVLQVGQRGERLNEDKKRSEEASTWTLVNTVHTPSIHLFRKCAWQSKVLCVNTESMVTVVSKHTRVMTQARTQEHGHATCS